MQKKSRGGGGGGGGGGWEEGVDVNKDLKLLCKIKVGGSGVMWCIRDVNQE